MFVKHALVLTLTLVAMVGQASANSEVQPKSCALLIPSEMYSALTTNPKDQISSKARAQEQASLREIITIAESKGYEAVTFLNLFNSTSRGAPIVNGGSIEFMPARPSDYSSNNNAIALTGKDVNTLMLEGHPVLTFARPEGQQYEQDNYIAGVALTTTNSCKPVIYATNSHRDGSPDQIACDVASTDTIQLGEMSGRTWYTSKLFCMDINIGFGSSGNCDVAHGRHKFVKSQTAAMEFAAKLPACN